MFGNSIKFVDYRDFTKNPEVKITPTWFFEGEKYENAQSLDKLAAITGCVIG
jgi:protein-disulfide isomerase